MRRLWRWLRRLTLVAVVLLIAGLLVEGFVLPALVHARILQALRRVDPDSTVELRRFGLWRLELAGMTCGAEPWLTADAVELRYDLLKLLQGRVDEVEARGVRWRLGIDDGRIDPGFDVVGASVNAGSPAVADRRDWPRLIALRDATIVVDTDDGELAIALDATLETTGAGARRLTLEGDGASLKWPGWPVAVDEGSLSITAIVDERLALRELRGRLDLAGLEVDGMPMAGLSMQLEQDTDRRLRFEVTGGGDSVPRVDVSGTLPPPERLVGSGDGSTESWTGSASVRAIVPVAPGVRRALLESGIELGDGGPINVAGELDLHGGDASGWSVRLSRGVIAFDGYTVTLTGSRAMLFDVGSRLEIDASATADCVTARVLPGSSVTAHGVAIDELVLEAAATGGDGAGTLVTAVIGPQAATFEIARDIMTTSGPLELHIAENDLRTTSGETAHISSAPVVAEFYLALSGGIVALDAGMRPTGPVSFQSGLVEGSIGALEIDLRLGRDTMGLPMQDATITIADGHVALPDRGVEAGGIAAAVSFDRLSPPSTLDGQRVTIDSARVGRLDLGDAEVRFALESPEMLRVEDAHWSMGGGGRFTASAFEVDPSDPLVRTTILVEALSLAYWLPLLTDGRASGEGLFDGRVPVSFRADALRSIRLGEGFLHARAGGGWIEVPDAARIETLLERSDRRFETDEQMQIVKQRLVEALVDYAYDTLTLDLLPEPEGILLRIATSGRGRRGDPPQEIGGLTINVHNMDLVLSRLLSIRSALDHAADGALEEFFND